MFDRKLASIQKIIAIEPIEGKDRIVLATIKGWKVIVGKDQFKVGDLCVYFEIDSILPDVEMFAQVKARSKLRIKAMKMGGVYSFGFCISIDEAKNLANILKTNWPAKIKEGQDLTEILNVEKYEEDEWNRRQTANQVQHGKLYKWFMQFTWFRYLVKGKKVSREWPSFLVKSDEERVENLTFDYKAWHEAGLKFHRTVKMDGQSATFALKDKEFYICSRNFRLSEKSDTDRVFFENAKQYKIEKLLKYLRDKIVPTLNIGKKIEFLYLQGEQCSPSIQKNRIGLKDLKLYIFNFIVATETGIHKLNPEDFRQIFFDFSGLECVPYLGEKELPTTIEELRKEAFGYYDEKRKLLREGIVLRNYKENISFKCVSPEYLIKHGI